MTKHERVNFVIQLATLGFQTFFMTNALGRFLIDQYDNFVWLPIALLSYAIITIPLAFRFYVRRQMAALKDAREQLAAADKSYDALWRTPSREALLEWCALARRAHAAMRRGGGTAAQLADAADKIVEKLEQDPDVAVAQLWARRNSGR